MAVNSTAERVAARYRLAMIPAPVMGVAKKVSGFLREHGVPHAIAGGMAVSIHGHPRMTKDVDILVPASAKAVIQQLGRTKPISGHLEGVTVTVDRVPVDFLYAAKGIGPNDISSAKVISGIPLVGLEALVLMKVGAGRPQDLADIIALLKLGKVPVAKIEKRLGKEDREDFQQLVEMAALDTKGETKKAGRLFIALLRRWA